MIPLVSDDAIATGSSSRAANLVESGSGTEADALARGGNLARRELRTHIHLA